MYDVHSEVGTYYKLSTNTNISNLTNEMNNKRSVKHLTDGLNTTFAIYKLNAAKKKTFRTH